LQWFDRTQATYVPRWRINEKNKWNLGDCSVELALEAIQDALWAIPGYKGAELARNRDEQVRILTKFFEKTSSPQRYFYERGLRGLMASFTDPTGKYGIRKAGSVKATMEWYDGQKVFELFDRTKPTYVPRWRIRENGMWQQGYESVQLAVEMMEDVLYVKIPGFRRALELGDRTLQLELLDEHLFSRSAPASYLRKDGYGSKLFSFRTKNPQAGIEDDTLESYLKFYSEQKELEWFS